ncbi:MAG TPA: biotin/lipoyl-containing protein [Gemmatimonadaceae bacterium]|nr:biotin/lipoyl-containing protein [Gemmatimonadaceae bacterium]
MNYIVTINGRTMEVALDAGGVRVAGQRVSAHLADVEGTPISLVTIDGVVHRVVVRRGDGRGQYALWIDGHRYEVEALDERMHAIRRLSAAGGAASGPSPLVAPMPGLIVRVNVQPGDAVQAGQGLVVIEAMKMENELRAPGAGTVRAVHARPGTAVEKGAPLVDFE